MRNKYMPATVDAKTAAKAIGKNLPISPKVSIEICNFIRYKELDKAITLLERVEEKKQAVPYKRFPNAAGHKPGMAAGRFPVKASGYFLGLLRNAKANAANQGLTGTLKITHIAAQRASEPFRARAKERVTFKRAHVEVIVTEDHGADAPGSRKSGISVDKASEKKEKKARPAKPAKKEAAPAAE